MRAILPVSRLRLLAAVLALVPACATAGGAGLAATAPLPGVDALRSPDGRHVMSVHAGALFVDGRRVRPRCELLTAPIWRADGDAVVWVERSGAQARLVVLPRVSRPADPLVWPLPATLGSERVHWAGATRVVVGPAVLDPRAVASWSE